MPRTLWFVAGAGAGVYAVARARRLAESLSVDGLRDRVEGVVSGARIFREEVRLGASEREAELRERYGIPAPRAEAPALSARTEAPDEPAPAHRTPRGEQH